MIGKQNQRCDVLNMRSNTPWAYFILFGSVSTFWLNTLMPPVELPRRNDLASQRCRAETTLLLSVSCETTLLLSMSLGEWNEFRTALDGECYTKAEILEYYESDGQRIWDQLPRATEYDMQWRESSQMGQDPGWTMTKGRWKRSSEAVDAASSRTIDDTASRTSHAVNSELAASENSARCLRQLADSRMLHVRRPPATPMPPAADDTLALMPQLERLPHVRRSHAATDALAVSEAVDGRWQRRSSDQLDASRNSDAPVIPRTFDAHLAQLDAMVTAPTTPGVVAATSSRNIDAHQLDASRNSDAPVIPTTVDAFLAQPDASENSDALALMPHAAADALALMPQVVLTCDQLEAMRPVSGHGGRFACTRQRELRAELLQSGTFEHDLTHEDWPWRDVIRSLRQDLRTTLVGPGVTLFTFKLVLGEMDQNYVKIPTCEADTGERHVFHIQRADNVAHHLHYHPNGKLDDPVKSQHNITVQNTLPGGYIIRQEHFTSDDYNGALQPVDFDERCITGPRVGRREAASACTILLDACGGQRRAVSVDVTDEIAFP
jgi:hypothetical protein